MRPNLRNNIPSAVKTFLAFGAVSLGLPFQAASWFKGMNRTKPHLAIFGRFEKNTD